MLESKLGVQNVKNIIKWKFLSVLHLPEVPTGLMALPV